MKALICPQCGAPLQAQSPNCPYCGIGLIHDGPVEAPSRGQIARPSWPGDEPAVPAEIPAGWVEHRDEWYGFTLAHPRGWQVVTTKSVVSVREDPVGYVSAFLWPLMLPEGDPIGSADTAAQQVAAYYIAQLQAADRSIQAWLLKDGDGQPGAAVGRTRRMYMNQPMEGFFRVVLSGRSAILSGYECPQGQGQARAGVMGQILASFRTVPSIQKQKVREMIEGAFEVEIPSGWLHQEMVDHNNAAGSGSAKFFTGREPQNLVCLAVPSIFWNFVENMWAAPFGGANVAPYMPAHIFCQQWLVPQMRRQYPDVAIVDVVDRMDLTYLSYLQLQNHPMRDQMQLSTALMTVTYSENGVRFKQRALVQNSKTASYGSPLWLAFLNVYFRAPENEFDRWLPILEGIANSYTINPAWQQVQQGAVDQYTYRSQVENSRRLAQISRTLSETSDIVTSSYWQRQETYDRLGQMWSNTILGRQDMASASGEVFNVPAGFDRYWVDSSSTVYGGSWSSTPDANWTPLEPTGT